MTALCFQNAALQAVRRGGLGLADGRGGLEGDAEVDGCAVGNTTLDTAGVVAAGCQALLGGGVAADAGLHLGGHEGVVVD